MIILIIGDCFSPNSSAYSLSFEMRSIHSSVCTVILLQLIAQGCSSSRVRQPSPSTTIPRSDTIASTVRSVGWNPETKSGKWHYIIRDSAIISISNDSNAQVRPIESTTSYTITITDSTSLLVLTVRMDSMIVTRRQSSPKIFSDTNHSQLHTVISKKNHLSNPSQQITTCTAGTNSPTTRLGELLIPLPTTRLNIHERWTDSSTSIVCHGRIALTESRITEYELIDSTSCKQLDAIGVHRLVSSTFTGSSAEGNNHLTAGGSGTGSAILCLQRDTGLLLSSNGESRLDLTATTSRGVFPFTQKTITDIRLQ